MSVHFQISHLMSMFSITSHWPWECRRSQDSGPRIWTNWRHFETLRGLFIQHYVACRVDFQHGLQVHILHVHILKFRIRTMHHFGHPAKTWARSRTLTSGKPAVSTDSLCAVSTDTMPETDPHATSAGTPKAQFHFDLSRQLVMPQFREHLQVTKAISKICGDNRISIAIPAWQNLYCTSSLLCPTQASGSCRASWSQLQVSPCISASLAKKSVNACKVARMAARKSFRARKHLASQLSTMKESQDRGWDMDPRYMGYTD